VRLRDRLLAERLQRVRARARSARATLLVTHSEPVAARAREAADPEEATWGAWTDRPPARRRTPRRFVTDEMSLRRRGSVAFQVPLADVSVAGCRVELIEFVATGDHVIARLPGLEPFGATVAWADERSAGLRFDRPLHPAVFDLLLSRLG
jgi:PilZ domain